MKEHFKRHPELNDTLQEQFLWLFQVTQTGFDPADNWHDISIQEFANYKLCDGDQGVNWKERGYGTIFDILMVCIYCLMTVIFYSLNCDYSVVSFSLEKISQSRGRVTCTEQDNPQF